MNAMIPESVITATKVEDTRDRLGFLERLFGRYFIQGEAEVFDWMGRLAQSYTGGFWEFYSLSNGGHFMAPRMGRVKIEAPNDFEAEVSEEAAGIIACMYALSHLAFKVSHRGGDTDALTEQYIALRAFAADHAERELILAAVD